MIKVTLETLRRAARRKKKGYFQEVVSKGVVFDGAVYLKPADYAALRARYSTPLLGDRVKRALHPLVAMIDRTFGSDLANCGGCDQRRHLLNKLGRKIGL